MKWNASVVFLSVLLPPLSYGIFLNGRRDKLYEHPRKDWWWIGNSSDPDVHRNVSELITSKGYPVEEHWVTTDDGYIIGIQRIPHGKDELIVSGQAREKPVVFLMHGIAQTSAHWVWNFPKQSLGFVLADAGYDVWLGNIRGNEYGVRHCCLECTSEKFWAYSLDELGGSDLKAFLDYVTGYTRVKRIRYIGYSLGVNLIMSLLAENPVYQDKVHSIIAMAPAVYVKGIKTTLRYLTPILLNIASMLGVKEFGLFNHLSPLHDITSAFCQNRAFTKSICQEVVPLFTGPSDNSQFNRSRLEVYLSHIPSGVSLRMLRQLLQIATREEFAKFDYGVSQNRIIYGQDRSPIYDLSKILTPVAVIWGSNDQLTTPEDVLYFSRNLKNIFDYHRVPYDKWSHLDFVWGLDAYKYVYSHLLKLLKF